MLAAAPSGRRKTFKPIQCSLRSCMWGTPFTVLFRLKSLKDINTDFHHSIWETIPTVLSNVPGMVHSVVSRNLPGTGIFLNELGYGRSRDWNIVFDLHDEYASGTVHWILFWRYCGIGWWWKLNPSAEIQHHSIHLAAVKQNSFKMLIFIYFLCWNLGVSTVTGKF